MITERSQTFVGRHTELEVLHEQLAAARRGEPRVVIVEGPAGIGKTTLVEHFLATAPDVTLARASGDESEADVLLGVLDQLLRHAGRLLEPSAGPIDAGMRLLDAIGELQSDGPAVLAIDDAQWADPDSLRALLFAARRLVDDGVLVLVAVRTRHGLPEGLLRLAGTAIVLEPLAVADVHELAGGAISLGGARRLHEHSGGSPLHARALLAELPPRAWEEGRARLPAPRTFAQLVVGRLAALPDDARRLLEAASVLGLASPLGAAARLARVDDPFAALEAAIEAELAQLGDGPELRFAHPLVRAAIYEHMGLSRRANLHLAAAAAAGDEGTALTHRVAACVGPDDALAGELEAFAARCTAERRWAAATTALVSAGRLSAARADRERRTLDAVEAALYAGDGPRARALAEATADFAPGARLDCVLAYIAVSTGQREETELRLERAWEACEGDPKLAARIAERRAFLGILRLRGQDAVDWARKARELDPARGLETWSLALGLYYTGRRAEAHALIDAERGLSSIKGSLLLADDELDAARAELEVPEGSLVVAARTLAKRAQLEFAAGNWDDAAVVADRAVALAAESDEVSAQAIAGWSAVLVPAARGEDCTTRLAELDALPAVFEAHEFAIRIAHAEVAAARGDHAPVLEALAPLAELERRDGVDDPGEWPWPHLYAEALQGEAEPFLDRYERIARELGARSMLARLLRVRAALHGDLAAAEAALDVLPPGMPYERARIEFEHGRLLRRLGRRRDAAQRLTAARDTLAALDARPLLERCTRELDACGLTPVKRSDPAGRTRLTPQERSIARLVASGLGNREVAAELLLSVKTVERHLTHIYRKLGVGSRAELPYTNRD